MAKTLTPIADVLKIVDVRQVLTLLREAQELPSTKPEEQNFRADRVERITRHLHEIQQGHTAPPFDVKHQRELNVLQTAHAKEIHVREIAKQYPVILELVQERDALKETSGKPDAGAAKELANLRAERDGLAKEVSKLTTKNGQMAEQVNDLKKQLTEAKAAAKKAAKPEAKESQSDKTKTE